MFPTGLSAADYAKFVTQLGTNHRMRRQVQILDLNHNLVEDVTSLFNDGQVNMDRTATVTRSATVHLFDPSHRIGLDTTSPGSGTVAPTYMLRLVRGIYVPTVGWVDIPIFTGPITRPNRNSDMLTIEAQGKEYLAQDNVWVTMVLKAGMNKIHAIRTIMGQGTGETLYRFPATGSSLANDVNLSRTKTWWQVAHSIARSMGRSLYYDGAGYLVCQPKSTTPVFTFSTGTGGTVASPADIGTNEKAIYNLYYVTGGTPVGGTTPATGYAVAPSSHPLSPTNLGRNGVPRYKRFDATVDTLTSHTACVAEAQAQLPGILTQSTALAFESLPVWHLEEHDYYTFVDTVAGYTLPAAVNQMSIPLTSAGNQSNGTHKLVSRPLRRIGSLA